MVILMKIAICDDSAMDRRIIRSMVEQYFKEYGISCEIVEFENGNYLIKDFKKDKFTIVFSDIFMDGLNGIQTTEEIRKIDKKCAIIFTTASREYAVESYTVNAAHYLLKPLSYTAFSESLDRCKSHFTQPRHIEIISNRLLVKIRITDIFYLEITNRLCKIHTKSGIIKTYRALAQMEKLLGGYPFLRCSRSFIVNMDYIKKVADSNFILINEEKVPLNIKNNLSIKQEYYDYKWDQNQIT